jgi:DNA-binding LacI/PurR family transcriptional regulator
VREAIGALVNDGLVERRQGAGTYVKKISRVATVGIVANLNMLSNSDCVYYHKLLNRIQEVLKCDGLQGVLLIGDSSNAESFIESTHLQNQDVLKQMIGVISVIELGEIANYFDKQGMPYVSIIHHHNRGSGFAIELDYREMIRLGVGAFFDAGIEDVALFIAEGEDELQNRRARGRVLRWFRECGLILPDEWIISIPITKIETAYEKFEQLWKRDEHPEGVFFLDDLVCEVALRAIVDLDISVPAQLSIITSSNVGKKFIFPVDLTQIQFDPVKIADSGWNLLQKLIKENTSEQLVEMACPVLIKGESVPS